jgi:phosphoribosylformimino-5-aminoimidazole carboxamide ribotide isomerase
MELIPAIDLLGGKVVRLERGDYDRVTVYADDPTVPARRFHAAGAGRLHVVDLDGARAGAPRNVDAMRAILDAVPIAVQVGGGVRDAESVERWLAAGADRVVLGTAAVKAPDMVRALCAAHPTRIVVAVDARAGQVAVEGWREASDRPVEALAREADAWGAAALLYTVIERDGVHGGPAVAETVRLQAAVRTTVIASGGVSSLDDVRRLAAAGVRAAVCGRALYSGRIDAAEAIQAAVEAGGGRSE